MNVAAEGNDSKRIVSKEIKVAAEENDLDVKNGALYKSKYLQISIITQKTIATFYLVKISINF